MTALDTLLGALGVIPALPGARCVIAGRIIRPRKHRRKETAA
jgi:hypothetical protein